jgi:hypothetical protein
VVRRNEARLYVRTEGFSPRKSGRMMNRDLRLIIFVNTYSLQDHKTFFTSWLIKLFTIQEERQITGPHAL